MSSSPPQSCMEKTQELMQPELEVFLLMEALEWLLTDQVAQQLVADSSQNSEESIQTWTRSLQWPSKFPWKKNVQGKQDRPLKVEMLLQMLTSQLMATQREQVQVPVPMLANSPPK